MFSVETQLVLMGAICLLAMGAGAIVVLWEMVVFLYEAYQSAREWLAHR